MINIVCFILGFLFGAGLGLYIGLCAIKDIKTELEKIKDM